MLKKGKLQVLLLVMLFSLLLTACSDDEVDTGEAETDRLEEVTDEDLISVIETNVEKLKAKDFDGYMATIHSDSPVYDVTSDTISELIDFTLDIELGNLRVEEKSDEEAAVLYTQRTVKVEGPEFQSNETVGKHLLRPENGDWKIYNSEVIEVTVLEDETNEQGAVADEMEGEYADMLSSLENPFDTDDWVLASYTEGDGEATAKYLNPEENLGNYSKMATLEYFKNGNELSGLKNFISILKESLNEVTTGKLIFTQLEETETEVLYEFSLTGDSTEMDQQELARVFVQDNDLYLVRYTVMEETIDNDEEIIEILKEVQ